MKLISAITRTGSMSRRCRQATPELAAAVRTPLTRMWQLAGGAGVQRRPLGSFQKPSLQDRP